MVKISRIDNAFLEVFKLQASPVEGHTLQKKEEKRRKRKGEKRSKIEKPKDVRHHLVQKFKNLISAHARAKMALNAILVARRTSCRVANAILTR